MSEIATQKQALTTALILAVTASNDESLKECLDLAEHFALGLSEFEVAAAKREALRQL